LNLSFGACDKEISGKKQLISKEKNDKYLNLRFIYYKIRPLAYDKQIKNCPKIVETTSADAASI
jgi:hypothetical protein